MGRPIIFKPLLTWDIVLAEALSELKDPVVLKALGDRKSRSRSADIRRLQYLLNNNPKFKAWLGEPDPATIKKHGLPIQYRLGHITTKHQDALDRLASASRTPQAKPQIEEEPGFMDRLHDYHAIAENHNISMGSIPTDPADLVDVYKDHKKSLLKDKQDQNAREHLDSLKDELRDARSWGSPDNVPKINNALDDIEKHYQHLLAYARSPKGNAPQGFDYSPAERSSLEKIVHSVEKHRLATIGGPMRLLEPNAEYYMEQITSPDLNTRRKYLGEVFSNAHRNSFSVDDYLATPEGKAQYGDTSTEATLLSALVNVNLSRRFLAFHDNVVQMVEKGYPKEYIDRVAQHFHGGVNDEGLVLTHPSLESYGRLSDLTDFTLTPQAFRKEFKSRLSQIPGSEELVEDHDKQFTSFTPALKRQASIWGSRKALVEANRDDLVNKLHDVDAKYIPQVDSLHQQASEHRDGLGLGEHENLPEDPTHLLMQVVQRSPEYKALQTQLDSETDGSRQSIQTQVSKLRKAVEDAPLPPAKKVEIASHNPDAEEHYRSSDIHLDEPLYKLKREDDPAEYHVRKAPSGFYHMARVSDTGGTTKHEEMMSLPEVTHLIDHLKETGSGGWSDQSRRKKHLEALTNLEREATDSKIHHVGYQNAVNELRGILGRHPGIEDNGEVLHKLAVEMFGDSPATRRLAEAQQPDYKPGQDLYKVSAEPLRNLIDSAQKHETLLRLKERLAGTMWDGVPLVVANHRYRVISEGAVEDPDVMSRLMPLMQAHDSNLERLENHRAKLKGLQVQLSKLVGQHTTAAHKAQDDLLFHDIANGHIKWHSRYPEVTYHGTPIKNAQGGDLFDADDYDHHSPLRLGPGVYTTKDYRVAQNGYAKVSGSSAGNSTSNIHPFTYALIQRGGKYFDAEEDHPEVQAHITKALYNKVPEFKNHLDINYNGDHLAFLSSHHGANFKDRLVSNPSPRAEGNKSWYDNLTGFSRGMGSYGVSKKHINEALADHGFHGITHIDHYYPNLNKHTTSTRENGHRANIIFDRGNLKNLYGNEEFSTTDKNVFKARQIIFTNLTKAYHDGDDPLRWHRVTGGGEDSRNAHHLYSGLGHLIETRMPASMQAEQLRAFVKAQGVTDDEMNASGLHDLEGKVTPNQVVDHIRAYKPNIQIKKLVESSQIPLRWDTEGWDYADAPPGAPPGTSGRHTLYHGDEPVAHIYEHRHEIESDRNERIKRQREREDDDTEQYQSYEDGEDFENYEPPYNPDSAWNEELDHADFLTHYPHGGDSESNDDLDRAKHTAEAAIRDMHDEYDDDGSGSGDKSVHENYTMPGGENYQEHLLINPESSFKHGHWQGKKGVFAHLRMKDRVDGDGKNTLNVQEVQSDLHQEGRTRGYSTEENSARLSQYTKHLLEAKAALSDFTKHLDEQHQKMVDSQHPDPGSVYPDNARERNDLSDKLSAANTNLQIAGRGQMRFGDELFKGDSWHQLAIKHALHHAAVNGYDRLSISPPEIQNNEYLTKPKEGQARHYGKTYPDYLNKLGRAFGTTTGKSLIGHYDPTTATMHPVSPTSDAPGRIPIHAHHIDIHPEMAEHLSKFGMSLWGTPNPKTLDPGYGSRLSKAKLLVYENGKLVESDDQPTREYKVPKFKTRRPRKIVVGQNPAPQQGSVEPKVATESTRSIPLAIPQNIYSRLGYRNHSVTENPKATNSSTYGSPGSHIASLLGSGWSGGVIHHIGSSPLASGHMTRHLIHSMTPEGDAKTFAEHIKDSATNMRVSRVGSPTARRNPTPYDWDGDTEGNPYRFAVGVEHISHQVRYTLPDGTHHVAHFFRGGTATPEGERIVLKSHDPRVPFLNSVLGEKYWTGYWNPEKKHLWLDLEDSWEESNYGDVESKVKSEYPGVRITIENESSPKGHGWEEI